MRAQLRRKLDAKLKNILKRIAHLEDRRTARAASIVARLATVRARLEAETDESRRNVIEDEIEVGGRTHAEHVVCVCVCVRACVRARVRVRACVCNPLRSD